MNETAVKFGYPDSLLADYDHWCVLLRPAQVTLGSVVLVCKDPAGRFGDISPEASSELVTVVARLEAALAAAFQYDKINYLMLMMVDPDVHFHVIPRYGSERSLAGTPFRDAFWPGPPDVTSRLDLDDDTLAAIGQAIRSELG
ncbi:MAG: HIT domain-containing protein [Myxococcota bacterium]